MILCSFPFQVFVVQLPNNNFSAMSEVCGRETYKSKPVNSLALSKGYSDENLSSFIYSF